MAEKSFGVKEINLIGASGTPTIESPNNLNLNAVNVAISTNVSVGGTLTVSGNVSVGGTLTYEDVTNVDSVGIITAREGIKIPEDKELTFDGVDGGKLYADGLNFLVEGTNQSGITYIRGGNSLILSGGNTSAHQTTILLDKPGGNGRCRLYYGGNSKLETTSTGIDVTGGITIGGNPLTIEPSDTDVQVTFDIAGDSSGGYTFTGPGNDGTTGNPDIYLIRGQRYRFNNTTTTNHPFEFRNADNNADYTDGITGSQSGIQDFNVQYDAPARLKYRCTIHTSTMLGDIYIVGAFPKISVSGQSDVVADNLADTLTLAAGSNVTLTTNASTDTITISSTNTTYSVGDGGLTQKNFTTTLKNKLDGIDTSADVTNSTTVASAGAIMDTDFSSNGFMKRTGSGSYTVDSNTYLTSLSSLDATKLINTIDNARLPTSIDIGTSGSVKANNVRTSGQTNNLTQAGYHLYHAAGGFEALTLVKNSSGYGTALFIHRLSTAGTGNLLEFQYNNSGVGNINTNGSQSFFSGGSDYRLKQDVENITDAITKIKSLRPVNYRWKNNPGLGYDTGFIAHEVQETGYFDHSVTGVKDGMRPKYDDPNQQEPDYQGLDHTKFTPMLVAALKEISDKVDALDTRLTSLENT